MNAVKKLTENDLNPFDNQGDNSTYNDVADSEYPKQRSRLKKAIEWMQKNVDDNWNHEDAIKPSYQSLIMADHFVSNLFLTKEHADIIEPDGDAAVVLKWIKGNKSVLLTVDGLALYLSYEEEGASPIFVNNIQFFDKTDSIPSEILEYIPNRSVNA
jgi:hypothetical protein